MVGYGGCKFSFGRVGRRGPWNNNHSAVNNDYKNILNGIGIVKN